MAINRTEQPFLVGNRGQSNFLIPCGRVVNLKDFELDKDTLLWNLEEAMLLKLLGHSSLGHSSGISIVFHNLGIYENCKLSLGFLVALMHTCYHRLSDLHSD